MAPKPRRVCLIDSSVLKQRKNGRRDSKRRNVKTSSQRSRRRMLRKRRLKRPPMHPRRRATKGGIRAYRNHLRFLQLLQWHQLQTHLLHLFPLLRHCLHQSPRICLPPYQQECRRLCRRLMTVRSRNPVFRRRLRCREDDVRETSHLTGCSGEKIQTYIAVC